MTHAAGTHLGGIRTPEDLRARCDVDEATGCWLWRMAKDGDGRPSMWFSPLGARVTAGILACWWERGRRPERGEAWHTTCGQARCCNPAHRVCGTRSTQMQQIDMRRSRETVARMKAGRCVIPPARVAEIRAARGTLREIAERFGVSVGYACSIRTGKARPVELSRDIRVTEAPRRVLRHESLTPEGIFARAGIGRYEPGESAIARAYGRLPNA